MSIVAPACRKALADATANWPKRNREDDGLLGDARHQKKKSDHNIGNAFDVTHDPASGCSGAVIAEIAISDPRVTYVIWNKRIYNRERASEGWRPYDGDNPHDKHCHVSIRADARDDVSPWAWSPEACGDTLKPEAGAAANTAGASTNTTGASTNTAGAPANTAVQAAQAAQAVPKGAEPVRKPVTPTPYPGVPLKRGASGILVTRVQERLAALQWNVVVDGNFGEETVKVVRAFQERQGLDADGAVGRATWQALFG